MANYAASSDFQEYIHVVSSDYSSDGMAEGRWDALLTRSTSLIDQYTGRVFAADSDTVGSSDVYMTRYFDAETDISGYTLWFDEDVCEIGVVSNGDSDATTIATDEYVTQPRNKAPYYSIKILTSANKDWTYDDDPENAIAITGIWAYSKTPPDAIKHACLRLAKWLEDQRKSNADLDRPALAGEGTIIMPTRLPADIKDILDMYKKREVWG